MQQESAVVEGSQIANVFQSVNQTAKCCEPASTVREPLWSPPIQNRYAGEQKLHLCQAKYNCRNIKMQYHPIFNSLHTKQRTSISPPGKVNSPLRFSYHPSQENHCQTTQRLVQELGYFSNVGSKSPWLHGDTKAETGESRMSTPQRPPSQAYYGFPAFETTHYECLISPFRGQCRCGGFCRLSRC